MGAGVTRAGVPVAPQSCQHGVLSISFRFYHFMSYTIPVVFIMHFGGHG